MNHHDPSYDETHELFVKYVKSTHEHWYTEDLFSFNWWLMLFVTVLFYVVWLKFLHKKRLTEILLYGALVSVCALVMDVVGVHLLWWGYPDHLVPIEPALLVIDLSQVPIAFSLIYQRYGDDTKKFLLGMTALSAFYSFLLEPLLAWLGIYRLHHWEYWYSFPIYILLALVVRFVVHRMQRIEQLAQS